VLIVQVLGSPVDAGVDEWLITPEEAKMLARSSNYAEEVATTEGIGPIIFLKNPKVLAQVHSPLDIFIAFKPGESRKPVDMATLTVTLIGFIHIDITNRLREYINETNLYIEDAQLSSGRHHFRIQIKDVNGNSNERDLLINVLEKKSN